MNKSILQIGDTIEIKNGYNNFSTSFPTSKRARSPKYRGLLVVEYHSDIFDNVTHLKQTEYRGRQISKVRFITESGFDTWRISNNITVYDGERGSINNKPGERGENTSMSCNRNRYKKGGSGGDRKPLRKSYETYKGETPGMGGGIYFNATQSKGREVNSKRQWVH